MVKSDSKRVSHFIEVKNKMCSAILLLGAIAFGIVGMVNLYNLRPAVNVAVPVIAGLIVFGMRAVSEHTGYKRAVKLIFMGLLNGVYLPLAWLTSPGSYSAMAFYAVLIVFIGLMLAQTTWEYLFPVLSMMEMVLLLYYEALHPEQYHLYTTVDARALDLGMNFVIVCLVMFIAINIMNHYFDDEHNRLFNVAITDQLTGIYNRGFLLQSLEEIHYKAIRDRNEFTILLMDLNHFKLVNDTFGHAAGDEVLKTFGNILKTASRSSDIPVRYGGDEFILVLPGTGREQARLVEERIQMLFEPLAKQYEAVELSVSIGIAENNDMPIDKMMKLADDHLYKRKNEMKQSKGERS